MYLRQDVNIAPGITLTTGTDGLDDTITGGIGGLGNLIKAGTGNLLLSGSNTFTGDLTISSGSVDVDGTLAPEVDVINQGILNINTTDTIASLNGSGDVNIVSGITLTTGTDGLDDTITGGIGGPVISLKQELAISCSVAATHSPVTSPLAAA